MLKSILRARHPCHQAVWLCEELGIPYHREVVSFEDRPDKSSATIRTVLEKAYKAERFGIPDNEDMGCHSALYMCGLLGLYPMMGQDWYFLTAPAFSRSVIQLGESGNKLVIIAPDASESHLYVESAQLNGAPLTRAWIRHEEFAGGAHLEFTLSEKETNWGKGCPPPSPLSSYRTSLGG